MLLGFLAFNELPVASAWPDGPVKGMFARSNVRPRASAGAKPVRGIGVVSTGHATRWKAATQLGCYSTPAPIAALSCGRVPKRPRLILHPLCIRASAGMRK